MGQKKTDRSKSRTRPNAQETKPSTPSSDPGSSDPGSSTPGSSARSSSTSRASGAPASSRPPEVAADLRVQLPYFVARIAIFLVLAVVLVVVGVEPLLALLIAFAVVGFLTWPLGRMQRRAAERSAREHAAKSPRASRPPAAPPEA